ncbi:uncharacterized protein BDW43DRAFT_258508 [Aspergillus alliaceus]|uniref:uncharacterized protein n=1 Tax=Petromyces alliaceus TaxID=209559 RepID=UPI0012A524A7|nr:uncharacterized protein BDW43DRAFT_258508 [Aspergillus alliaceus]KAB8239572.1 hypothetical protein BDW43DRAFT_258508 [Aspergillus alliaceus]
MPPRALPTGTLSVTSPRGSLSVTLPTGSLSTTGRSRTRTSRGGTRDHQLCLLRPLYEEHTVASRSSRDESSDAQERKDGGGLHFGSMGK